MNLLNIDGASCRLYERDESCERYNNHLTFENGIELRVHEGTASWSCRADGRNEKVSQYATGKRRGVCSKLGYLLGLLHVIGIGSQ